MLRSLESVETAPRAVEKILELSPDVVFLDVQMPGMDGFEVLRALPNQDLPAVIFLTVYEQHALRAFEVNALDYLLKPVDDVRFDNAVQRARQVKGAGCRIQMAERIPRMLEENSKTQCDQLCEPHCFKSFREADATLSDVEQAQHLVLRPAGNSFAIPALAQAIAVDTKLSCDVVPTSAPIRGQKSTEAHQATALSTQALPQPASPPRPAPPPSSFHPSRCHPR